MSSPTIQAAIDTLAPYRSATVTAQWYRDPASFYGTYDPCTTLSAVIVSVVGATGSSPVQILLFHKGTYVGTATDRPAAFVSVDELASTDDTVALTFKTPGSCNACDDGTFTPITYHWNGRGVDASRLPPPLS